MPYTDPEKERERDRAWRKANAEKVRERKRAYYAANAEKVLEQQRAWCKANAEKMRERNHKRHGNVPLRPAPTACDVCGAEGKKLVSEHDHVTGVWRGWVCGRCNLALHTLDLPPERLEALLAFQRRGGAPTFGDPDYLDGSGI